MMLNFYEYVEKKHFNFQYIRSWWRRSLNREQMMSDHAQERAGDYHYGHVHHDHAQEKASS